MSIRVKKDRDYYRKLNKKRYPRGIYSFDGSRVCKVCKKRKSVYLFIYLNYLCFPLQWICRDCFNKKKRDSYRLNKNK